MWSFLLYHPDKRALQMLKKMNRITSLAAIFFTALTIGAPFAFCFGNSSSHSKKCTLTMPAHLAPKGVSKLKFSGFGVSIPAAKSDAVFECHIEVDIFDSSACARATTEESEDKNFECGDSPDSPASPLVPAPAPSPDPG